MTRAYLAELGKLRRPSTAVVIALAAVLSILGTALTFALAKSGSHAGGDSFNGTLERLASGDGLTAGFAAGMGFIGLLVFVLTIAATTSEYGHGTLRANLLVQPSRPTWLGGRLLAQLTVLVGAVLLALVAGVAAALVMGEIRGVPMGHWASGSALAAAGGNLLNALLGAVCFGLVGTALGVVARSTVLALAVGIAWAFPLEHIIQNAWPAADQVFPGLLFAAVSFGGMADAPYGSAVAAACGYAVVALGLAFAVLARRDVTA